MRQRTRSRAYQQRREEVLMVASRLINSEGLANATLSAVADELGVRHNTLYHYFKDRKELHRTALYRTLSLREESLDLALKVNGSSLDKLTTYLELELSAEPDTRVDSAGGRGLTGAERKRFLDRKQSQMRRTAQLIETGISEGTIAPCDPVVRSFALDAIVNRFVAPPPTMPRGPQARGAQARASQNGGTVGGPVVDVLRNGLLLPGREMPEPQPEPDDRDIVEILGLELDVDDAEGLELRSLLQNAARCFNEQGWDAAIPTMAARLKKSKTVYYQIAADKQELLFHCLSRGCSLIAASHRSTNQNASSPAQGVVLHYHYLYRAHDSAVGPLPLFNEIERLHPHHRRLISIRARSLRMRAERRISDAIRTGWFRDFAPQLLQSIFGAMAWDLDLRVYGEQSGFTFEHIARENLRLVFEGLAAR